MAQIELKMAEMDSTDPPSPKNQKRQNTKYNPTKTKKYSLPPPKPQRLFIPTPKCQNPQVNQGPPQTQQNLTMTASELQHYCEWVQSQNVHDKSHIQEASLVTRKDPHTAYGPAAYIPKAIPYLIAYLHAAAGYPV